ncbi:hypothetical protein EJ377_23370 [Chryseobacterium arthrosphaerae]|uniref:Uncharacterized protein n=1 Tax=Chryseobacterium arthrosphaerae TaxID=651561 RepID=A0A432DUQ5_9FLAO|nr:hypothetical protein EJ377_23370 [Chryseobacterium arthrosphaerae]
MDNKKSYTSNAAIIMSEDGKQAELFLPESEGSLVLDKKASKKRLSIQRKVYTDQSKKYLHPETCQ